MNTTFKHEIELEYEDYPKVWEHEEYLAFLEKNHPSIVKLTDEGKKEENGLIYYDTRVLPKLPIPSALQSAISSEQLEYNEVVGWNPDENRHEMQAILPRAQFIQVTGHFSLEKIGERKYLRVAEMSLKVKIPILGRAIAKYLASELEKSYSKEAELRGEFGREYLYK